MSLICSWCKLPMDDPADRVTDHIIPKCRGGPDKPWNRQRLHRRCNGPGGKGSKLTPEAERLAAEHGIVLREPLPTSWPGSNNAKERGKPNPGRAPRPAHDAIVRRVYEVDCRTCGSVIAAERSHEEAMAARRDHIAECRVRVETPQRAVPWLRTVRVRVRENEKAPARHRGQIARPEAIPTSPTAIVARQPTFSRNRHAGHGEGPAPGLAPPRLIGVRVTAIRSVRTAEGKFVQISNAALQDERLSWSARGILAFVLSLPPDQHLTAAWLEGQSPDGREEVRSALRELEACGYYTRTRKPGLRGHWEWEQVISDASSQVAPCDGKPSDGNAADGKPSDKRPNTEDLKDVGQNDLASRHARAKSSASANLTVADAVNAVRQAVERVHSAADAEDLSDYDALGLFYTYVGNRRPRNLVTYLAKIFGDGPYLDTFLSNSQPACTRCAQWESNCKCVAA